MSFPLALTCVLVLLCCGFGCAGASLGAQRPVLRQLDYRVEFDAGLRGGRTEMCFVGEPPAELGPIVGNGPDLMGPVRVTRGGHGPLPRLGGRVLLGELPPDACISYRFALRAGGFAGMRRQGALLTSQDLWLLRPIEDTRATLSFTLPPHMQASLPWGGEGRRRALPASALALAGHVTLGRFQETRTRAAGSELNLVILPGQLALPATALMRCIGGAIHAVATIYGRFPSDALHAVVVPVGPDLEGGRADPIAFGLVRRGGGASVMLLVREDATEADVRAHWVTTHELSHLLLPLLAHRDGWLSEGVATYYQEVARVRAGLESEQDAWRRLVDGLQRGAEDASTDTTSALGDTAAHMHQSGHFYRVYWSGAAFALSADVMMRRRAEPSSLDALLCAAGPDFHALVAVVSGDVVARRFDALLGEDVFVPMRSEWAARRDFPAVGELLEQLGVRVTGDQVLLDDSAPLAAIRHAIMDPRTPAQARRRAQGEAAAFSGGSCR